MELGVRELLVGGGVIVILAIVFDAIRRHRRHKNPGIRMDLDLTGSVSGDLFNTELPAGGARPARASGMESVQGTGGRVAHGAVMEDLSIGGVNQHGVASGQESTANRPHSMGISRVHDFGASDLDEDLVNISEQSSPHMQAQNQGAAPVGREAGKATDQVSKAQHNALKKDSSTEADHDQSSEAASTAVEDVLGVTVLAKGDQHFTGQNLLRCFIGAGLRYGQHNVFHLFDVDDALKEKPLISVTNALEPRTFDMANMADFSTSAIALYLPIPGPNDPEGAFGRFLTLADMLAKGLDGQLCDLYQKPLAQSTLVQMHDRLLKVCEPSSAQTPHRAELESAELV